MKKITIGSIILALTSLLFIVPAGAISVLGVDDSTETVTEEIVIYAEPPSKSAAVQLRLAISGGEITSFKQPNTSDLLSIGTCDNGSSYTKSNVCVDIAATDSDVARGEVLGVITIKKDTPSTTVSIEKQTENAYYSSGGNLLADNGQAGPFVLGISDVITAQGREPRTSVVATSAAVVTLLAIGLATGAGLGVGFTVTANEVYKLHLQQE